MSPSSPPINLTEFPPQRPEPCRTQGNFEVDSYGRESPLGSRSPSPISPTGSQSYRGGPSTDRAPCSPSQQTHRDFAAFAKSLRKYPSLAERSPSAELLQQLIKQTQEKFFSKSSHYSKSVRNFYEKQNSDNSVDKPTKMPKNTQNLQALGRIKKSDQRDDLAKQCDTKTKSKTKKIRSGYKSPTPGCSREIRVRDSFDYLSSSIARPPPGVASGDRTQPDRQDRTVRSLRDSLVKVFGEQEPVLAYPVCPTMQSRYERHKREHHSLCSKVFKRSESDSASAGSPSLSLGPKPWQFCGLPVASTSFTPEELKVCCVCKKPLPCDCFSEEELEEKRKLEDIVCSWLKELPVYANENPHDKFIRDAVIKKLIDTISLIKDDEFDDKGKEIIKLSIARMPMWLPADERDREAFKNKITNNLFDKIKAFRHRDKFYDSIENWLQKITFDDEAKLDKEKLASEFSKALKEIALDRPSNDSVYREMLKSKIFDMLAVLPIKSSFVKNDILNLLSDKLADTLLRLPKEEIKPDPKPTSTTAVRDEIETILMDSFKNNPIIDSLSTDVKQKAAKDLIPKLQGILLNRDGRNVSQELDGEIRNWFSKLAKDGVYVDEKDQDEFIKDLSTKLKVPDFIKMIKEEEKSGELVQLLLDWVGGLPGAPDINKPEIRVMVEDLANDLQEMQQSGDETELIRRVGNWLRNTGAKAGIDIRPGTEEEFAKKLVPKISQLNKSRKRWSRNSQSFRFNSTMDDTQLKNALMDDIHDVIDLSHVTNRDEVESKLNDILADLVMRGIDPDDARDQILSVLESGNISGEEALNISDKLMARANEMSRSIRSNDMSSDFISHGKPTTSTPQKQIKRKSYEERKYYDDLNAQIYDWISKQNLPIENAEKQAIARELASDLLDRQKYLQLNPGAKTSPREESENLKYQIFKRLNKQVDNAVLNSLLSKADSLMTMIKRTPVPILVNRQFDQEYKDDRLIQDSDEFVQENLEGGIFDWLRSSSITQQCDEREKKMLEELVPTLAQTLTSTLSSLSPAKSGQETDEILLGVITEHLKKTMGKNRSNDYIRKKAEHMLNYLKGLQLFQNISVREDRVAERSHMQQINESVRKWCNDLDLPNTERGRQMKEDLNNRLMLKIGELNMNPQILNDDFLYEHMLSDFLDQELSKLPIDQNKIEEMKANIIDTINEARLKVKHDYAGQAYKQQLRDTISKTLPQMENPPASFEVMKDNLADAFINLHFAEDDIALKTKFKKKIKDTINKFVRDYTRRYPDTPLNSEQLNRDLYSALNKVVVPDDDSMRSEVEQVRIKDLIKDHLEEPLQKLSSTEALHANKIITVMGKRLYEMEKENDEYPDENYEEKQRLEIEKYLQKIPFKDSVNVGDTTDKIMEDMKNTKHSRTFTGTSRSPSQYQFQNAAQYLPSNLSLDDQAEMKSLKPSRTFSGLRGTSTSDIAGSVSQYPTTLSVEDQEHLKAIRKRARPCKVALTSACRCKPTGTITLKDAAVNPPPLDTGSQTEMAKEDQSAQCWCPKAEAKTSVHRVPCQSRSQIITKPCPQKKVSTGSQVEISPYVVIKEYFWDSEVKCPNTLREPSRSCLSSSHVIQQDTCDSHTCMSPEPEPCITPCRPKVTRLGSFEDNEHVDSCRPTPRRQFSRPLSEELEWSMNPRNQYPGRSRFYRDEQEQERQNKCGCSRKVSACRGRRPVFCSSCRNDPMKSCAKCCGATQCPFPARFYFR
ncbi:uncharacterized protein isoform X2 [Choristoneura fumiferana]